MSWEQYGAILARQREELQRERDEPPTDCPNDGTNLEAGPNGELHCPFDGWTWQAGREVIGPSVP